MICKFSLSLNHESRQFRDLGLNLVYHEMPLSFYGGYRTVVYSRVYHNPCLGLPVDLLRQTLDSSSCRKIPEDKIINNIERFQRYCQEDWEKKISQLKTYRDPTLLKEDTDLEAQVKRLSKVGFSNFNESRKRRSSKLGQIYHELSNSNSNRDKRDLSLIATSIGAVASIFSSILSLSSTIHQAYSFKEFEAKNTRVIKTIQDSIEHYATLSSAITDDLESLSHAICGRTYEISRFAAHDLSKKIVVDYVRTIEVEALSVFSNEVPTSLDFYQSIMEVCSDSDNDDEFCRKLINRGLVKLHFANMNITDDFTLTAHILLNLPVLSQEFRNAQRISILNVGYFSGINYRKLNLPTDLLEFEGKYYALNIADCQNQLCHISAVYSDRSALCIESLFNNCTLGCESIDYGDRQVCDYRVITGIGNLVAASNAIYFSTETTILDSFSIINETVFLPNNGKLLCQFGNTHKLEKSFFLNPNSKAQSSVVKPNFKDLEFLSFEELPTHDSLSKNFSRTIEQLIKSDDHLKINGRQYSTIAIILCSAFCQIALLFVYASRKMLKNFLLALPEFANYVRSRRKTVKNTSSDPENPNDQENIGLYPIISASHTDEATSEIKIHD